MSRGCRWDALDTDETWHALDAVGGMGGHFHALREMTMTRQAWIERGKALGPELKEHAARHDEDGTFVVESCEALKAEGLYKALIPTELGGLGATYSEVSELIRELAKACPSTALAFSMHSHLIGTTVFRYRGGQPGEQLLRKVAAEDLVLVSTGAGDWLESTGTLTKVDGGYHFTARKAFCSGSPIGDMLMTSGRYDDPEKGPQVLHFLLPLSTQGVMRGNDWDTHGMRGSASHTTVIERAFVPEASITLARAPGVWLPLFDVTCMVALPLIMSAYVGVAERAVELALEHASKRRDDVDVQMSTGEMLNQLFVAQCAWRAMVDNAADLAFKPNWPTTSRTVQGKTVTAEACIATVSKAMEVAGGSAYFRKHRIEQLMRDVRAATYHPLQAKRQQRMTGRIALGLEPV